MQLLWKVHVVAYGCILYLLIGSFSDMISYNNLYWYAKVLKFLNQHTSCKKIQHTLEKVALSW